MTISVEKTQNNALRILCVSHLFPNKRWPNFGVFVKERLKALSKVVDVKIVAPLPYFPLIDLLPKYKNISKIPDTENLDNLVISHPKYFLIPKYMKFLDGYLYFVSINSFVSSLIFNKKTIDLLDFHWVYPDAYAGLKWAKKFSKKIIVTVRGNESIYYHEKSIIKEFIANTLRSVDHVIAVSSDLKNKLITDYGVAPYNISVIPNGIDDIKFFLINKEKARKACGLKNNKKYILSLSRLSHEKGLEYLFKAFYFLNAENTELVVVGDGPLKEKLLRMASDLKIANRVKFIGAVPHKETYLWYNAADVYCLPSLWEGCPNVIIESLACGTPVVSTKVGGIPDLVSAKDYGFLVPPEDSMSLAGALGDALKKRWDRGSIAAFGSQNTWDKVANRVVEVFESVLESGR